MWMDSAGGTEREPISCGELNKERAVKIKKNKEPLMRGNFDPGGPVKASASIQRTGLQRIDQ